MKRLLSAMLVIAAFTLVTFNRAPPPHRTLAPPPKPVVLPFFTQTGAGSLYSNRLVGRKTAAGDRFTQRGFTAAHPSLPLGTIVRVTNIDNGLMIKVEIDDRGPYTRGRIIDLSSAAGNALGIARGLAANVRLEAFEKDQVPKDQVPGQMASTAPP